MKAIVEIPDSCVGCPFSDVYQFAPDYDDEVICDVVPVHMSYWDAKKRHENCPLMKLINNSSPENNGDKIRLSTDEDIAKILSVKTSYMESTWLNWLRREVKTHEMPILWE